jgi:hypothetical protein
MYPIWGGQFFLFKRAVYIFVWSACASIDGSSLSKLQDMVEYWMDSLQHRVPGASFMLVVTHIDCANSEEILAEQVAWVKTVVQRKLSAQRADGRSRPQIQTLRVWDDGTSIPVNCLDGTGITNLRRKMVSFAMSMPFYKEYWPQPFLTLRMSLEQAKQSMSVWLPWKQYESLASDSGISSNQLEIATRFLHDTGVIYYFGDVSSAMNSDASDLEESMLMNTVYISARWMVDSIKGLIRHDRDLLLSYFTGKKDKLRMRRVRRLMYFGILHEDLSPFLWPQDNASADFWANVRQRKLDGEEWSEDVAVSKDDFMRIHALLEGFDIMVPSASTSKASTAKEFLVPTLIAQGCKRALEAATLASDEAVHWTVLTYPAMPPGAFDRLITRGYALSSYSDFRYCV